MQKQLQALVGKLKKIKSYAHNPDTVPWIERELEAILSSEQPSVSVRPGWVCKSAIGVQWTDTKPEWFESYGWSCFDEALIVDESLTDPWPDKPNGGPDCILEIKL